VKQIALMVKADDMQKLLETSERSTALEKKIWRQT
jgi:hypothetical protein